VILGCAFIMALGDVLDPRAITVRVCGCGGAPSGDIAILVWRTQCQKSVVFCFNRGAHFVSLFLVLNG
jgi:hypothetical protein